MRMNTVKFAWKHIFQLYIRASDKGVPSSLSSDMTLIIRVQDVNDQPPEFDRTTVPTPYPLHFREKESPQCANVSVAVDRDSELNFTIICYYLYGEFHFDPVLVCFVSFTLNQFDLFVEFHLTQF